MFTALHNGVALCTAMVIEIPRSEVIHKLAKVLSLGPTVSVLTLAVTITLGYYCFTGLLKLLVV